MSGRTVILAFVLASIAPALLAAELDEKARCEAIGSIGVAGMTADGVITLRLRSLPPGPIGEGELRYVPGDPQYEDIKGHIGRIATGESKPVRPWC